MLSSSLASYRSHRETKAAMRFAILILAVVIVAVTADRLKSDCENHRDSAEKIGTIMKLIPKCKFNGDYDALQCYQDSKFCVCYDEKGHPASPISTGIKECGCYLEQKRQIDGGWEFPFTSQCEADGKWAQRQCWEHSCHCVDKEGKRVSDFKNKDELDELDC